MEEYKDIFSSPTGVPMHYPVNHPIDLTPSAPFPNGPFYHRSLMENDEIKRPIQEILQRGTSNPTPPFAEARLYWYKRKMGPGGSALITEH
jgi:hypothetical protein